MTLLPLFHTPSPSPLLPFLARVLPREPLPGLLLLFVSGRWRGSPHAPPQQRPWDVPLHARCLSSLLKAPSFVQIREKGRPRNLSLQKGSLGRAWALCALYLYSPLHCPEPSPAVCPGQLEAWPVYPGYLPPNAPPCPRPHAGSFGSLLRAPNLVPGAEPQYWALTGEDTSLSSQNLPPRGLAPRRHFSSRGLYPSWPKVSRPGGTTVPAFSPSCFLAGSLQRPFGLLEPSTPPGLLARFTVPLASL